MGRVRLCIGRYATTPYMIRQTGIRVYSLEELCYYLSQNAMLLDSEFITAELVEWIDVQLQLPELSKELNVMLRNESPLSSFVAQILEYGHYGNEESQNEILTVIKDNAKLNIYEKKKKRIDHLAANGYYEQAYTEYQKLLSTVMGKDLALTGAIYTAMGKVAARMFYYELAEEMFEKAYKITYRKESMLYYICAVKMHGTVEEQKQKLTASMELCELEAEADHLVNQVLEKWEHSDVMGMLQQMEQLGQDGKNAQYYAMVEQTVDQCKEEYRKHTQR